METSVKCIVFIIFTIYVTNCVYGAGECPNSTPKAELMKLAPCGSTARDTNAVVSSSCCAQVRNVGQDLKCLCEAMLSNSAKRFGIKPEIALTIPKRCNFADRPVGYQCGAYTLP